MCCARGWGKVWQTSESTANKHDIRYLIVEESIGGKVSLFPPPSFSPLLLPPPGKSPRPQLLEGGGNVEPNPIANKLAIVWSFEAGVVLGGAMLAL